MVKQALADTSRRTPGPKLRILLEQFGPFVNQAAAQRAQVDCLEAMKGKFERVENPPNAFFQHSVPLGILCKSLFQFVKVLKNNVFNQPDRELAVFWGT